MFSNSFDYFQFVDLFSFSFLLINIFVSFQKELLASQIGKASLVNRRIE